MKAGGLLARLRTRLGALRPGLARAPVRVHLLVKGRIGAGWIDLDREVTLPAGPGATLARLLDEAERQAPGLQAALAASPHLRHTLMRNGERCPLPENQGRELKDGDEIYLLGPIAGG